MRRRRAAASSVARQRLMTYRQMVHDSEVVAAVDGLSAHRADLEMPQFVHGTAFRDRSGRAHAV
ncbi:hypothetical protein ABIC65_002395 [Sphingomonas trueperi]|uniref:hypothetical protein n=1 Tax=Sphingomonas trueperi TaxID=53317 RepID=UPI00339395B3